MRRSLVSAAVSAAALFSLTLTGCDGVDKAMSCAGTALTIVKAVDDLEEAADQAVLNPDEADKSFDRIEKDLEKIDKNAGEVDVEKALGHLRTAVEDAQQAVDEGRDPDVKSLGKAADEVSKVCTG